MSVLQAFWTVLIVVLANTVSIFSTNALCPKVCRCYDTVIDCRNAELTAVPSFHMENAHRYKNLMLDNNNISYLDGMSFGSLPNLEVLILKNNSVENFDGDVFCFLQHLKQLDLGANQIAELRHDAFQGCKSLKILSLSDNFICDFQTISDSLKSLTNVQSLSLAYNSDASFCKGYPLNPAVPVGLSHMTQLKHLSLAQNIYNTLNRDHLKPLSGLSLTHLNLSQTSISNVSDNVFQDLSHLQELDLSMQAGGAAEWITRALSSLSKSNLTVLKLRHVFIDQLDRHLSHTFLQPLRRLNLTVLDLGHSYAAWTSKLPSNYFRDTPHLQELFLDHSNVKHIMPAAFVGLTRLRRLHLHDNLISCSWRCTFLDANRPLPRLQYLDLSNNVISDDKLGAIDGDMFPSLKTLLLKSNRLTTVNPEQFQLEKGILQKLDLSENPIKILPPRAFSAMPSLKQLVLSECRHIKEIQPDAFAGLEHLTDLIMNDNNLREIHKNSFINLTKLTNLELRNSLNRIAREFHSFENLASVKLERIDLSQNALGKFPAFIKYQTSLQYLNFSRNAIVHWNGLDFKDIATLEVLDLSANNILELHFDMFKYLKNLNELDMSGNPFYCSCGTKSIKSILPNPNIILVNSANVICAAPSSVAGTPLVAFHPSLWSCSVRQGFLLGLCLVLAGVTVLFIVRLLWTKMKRRRKPYQHVPPVPPDADSDNFIPLKTSNGLSYSVDCGSQQVNENTV